MLIANVLLLNLLIAMFSNTFNRIEENANVIWKFQKFKIIFEYHTNDISVVPFAPPLNLIDFVCMIFSGVYLGNQKHKKENENKNNDEYNGIKGNQLFVQLWVLNTPNLERF